MKTQKFVYDFSQGEASQKSLLGGKGANLCEMTRMEIPVPPGFVVTTDACHAFLDNEKQFPAGMWAEVEKHLKTLEKTMGKTLGDPKDPLLVSIRSGAPISMPGMMDTVLNLGLNDKTVEGLAKITDNPTFAYDSYRRFLQMFANVVLGLEGSLFEKAITAHKKKVGKKEDTDLSADDWKVLAEEFQTIIKKESGAPFPQEPEKQLERSVRAVFESWLNPRAIRYRRINRISDDLGTAVNVQAMVFGNMGDQSGTGVAFTRNPSTGEKKLFGEFLLNAQGEDVVAGIRTPRDIQELDNVSSKVFAQFKDIAEKLETHFHDMQDLEFTIQQGKLFLLQTRTGKRSAAADLKIAIDMVEEGLIDKKEAVLRVSPDSLDKLLHPQIAPGVKRDVLAKGLPASPGAAVGQIVFTADRAESLAAKGKKVILVRHETSPDDIHGMFAAEGILTSCGGMTSHAAVVARGMGKPCVAGAGSISIDEDTGKMTIGKDTFSEGDDLTLDGASGEVLRGACKTKKPTLSGNFQTILDWAEELTPSFRVRTNADTPDDSAKAREFGAKGIGLCRTEHMFFAPERIRVVQEMILSQTEKQREKALAKLLPFQKEDFIGIFNAMDGLPVTIRLLDPPLHEFLPHEKKDIAELAQSFDLKESEVRSLVSSLQEQNPMLGHRGCRLLITHPEVARMQARAIVEAACECHKKGIKALPEIMIPLVGAVAEFTVLREEIEQVVDSVFAEQKTTVPVKIGTMIEIPRACLIADKIAEHADFFSFGTNDLTQMTFGYSRDDAGKFLPYYVSERILSDDPFQTLDQEGVGQLIVQAVEKARTVKPDLKIGICGEHGGDPSSIEFCFHQDFQYVSCSPFRVPVARVAAAQSHLRKFG